MHACHGHRSFTRLAVVQRYDAAAINAPGNVVFVLARSDTRIALDAAVSVTQKLHTRHRLFPPKPRGSDTEWLSVPACPSQDQNRMS